MTANENQESPSGELRALLRLATPIVVVQLGMMAMGIVDVAMLGRVSKADVAACGLGNSYSWLVVNFGMGVLLALDPILSQALGAKDPRAFASGCKRGLVVAALLTVPASIAWALTGEALTLLDQSESVVPKAEAYVHSMIPCIFAFFGFIVLRVALQAMHVVRSLVVVTLLANVANFGLDALLIHGGLGIEPMGIVGCGIATAICRWLMFLGLLALSWKQLRSALRGSLRPAFAIAPLLHVLRYGLPIGFHMIVELGAFVVVMFWMGHLGDKVTPVAGHVLAIQLAAFSFMMPLGVSIAASVRVGWAVGEGDGARVRRRAYVALATGAAIMSIWGLLFWLAPHPLLRIFTDDTKVLAVAATLMPIAALFQVFDGLQVVAGGVLRGVGDTLVTALCHVGGFWLIGIPIGYHLAFRRDLGPAGLWWGLVLGLFLVSAVLILRMQHKIRGDPRRI